MPKRLKLVKGFLNNQTIDEVVGLNIAYSAPNPVTATAYTSAYDSSTLQGIAFDAFGNLWAVDSNLDRIVMYPPQNQFNGQPATFLIGQSSFNTSANVGVTQSSFQFPTLIAFDKNNNLWVYDKNANRILGFQYPFGSGGILNASWVIGQTSFTTNATGISANLFSSNINGIVFDNQNNLWVSDTGNNRVLGFSASKIYSINPSASWVIGQTSFTTNAENSGGTSDKSLWNPQGVAIDKNGYLWVVDSANYRLLGYKNPQSIMPSADYLIGQASFTTTTSGVGQNIFNGITSMSFDNSGNLWVYDYYRILGFASADLYGNNQPNASWLMFQTSYTAELSSTLYQGYAMQYDMAGFWYQVPIPNEEIVTALPNPYQIYYGRPLYLAFNSEDDMWISDTDNYRILQYKNSDITSNDYPYSCSRVLGQNQFYIQGQSGFTQYNLDSANDIAFDKNNNLWCADYSGMVKGFQYPNYSQQVMQNWAIGGSFTTAGGLTQNGMGTFNHAVSFDNFGNMFTTDNHYNRILGFSAGSLYGNNQPNAFVVIGQPNFTTGSDVGTTTQSTLYIYNNYGGQLAGKVAFDANNNMYVADTFNNRVMIFLYGSGFTNGMNASIVLGQTSFTTSTAGSTSSELKSPTGILIDKAGNLWVMDAGNGRVQKFVPPFTTGMAASVSITGFYASNINAGGLVFDLLGNLLVADTYNNRILGFPPSALNATTTVSSATIVLGQPNFTSVTGSLGSQALYHPAGLAINPATGDLMCVDAVNNRIVGWYYLHKQTQSNALDSKYIFYNE